MNCLSKPSLHFPRFAFYSYLRPRINTFQDVNPHFVDIHTHRRTAGSETRLLSVRIGHDTPPEKGVRFSAGIHPWDAEEARDSWLDTIRTMRPDAIGETGLDRAAATDTTLQREWFVRQRDLARQMRLPLIVHCVRAYEESIPLLKDFPLPVVFHGFTGSERLAARLTGKGFYLSFGETLFRSPRTRKALAAVPCERFFLETDCSPLSIETIYAEAAGIRGVSIERLKENIETNFLTIFGK